uniref:Uncharacterized protein n=1 Tax=Sphaerodactylus townsendi TaxID=933632 RepID=A0ACB8ET39_9SAUR
MITVSQNVESQRLYNFAQLQSLTLACVVGPKDTVFPLPCLEDISPSLTEISGRSIKLERIFAKLSRPSNAGVMVYCSRDTKHHLFAPMARKLVGHFVKHH